MRRCPNWDSMEHNWIIIRGTWLFWRHYRVCCACGLTQRLFSVGDKTENVLFVIRRTDGT